MAKQMKDDPEMERYVEGLRDLAHWLDTYSGMFPVPSPVDALYRVYPFRPQLHPWDAIKTLTPLLANGASVQQRVSGDLVTITRSFGPHHLGIAAHIRDVGRRDTVSRVEWVVDDLVTAALEANRG